MGQRLVLQFYKTQDAAEPLATIYYHWSAYTTSALSEIDTIISNFSDDFDDRSDIEKLIQIYVGTSGVVMGDAEEFERLTGIRQNPDRLNRNTGLMAISQEEQDGLLSWSEGTVLIYLDTKTFDFASLFFPYDMEDFKYFYDDETEDELKKLYKEALSEAVEINADNLHLADIDYYIDLVHQNNWFIIDGRLCAPIE